MGNASIPSTNSNRISKLPLRRDDGFSDTDLDSEVISLLEENARLRALVTQLSGLVLKHVVGQK